MTRLVNVQSGDGERERERRRADKYRLLFGSNITGQRRKGSSVTLCNFVKEKPARVVLLRFRS